MLHSCALSNFDLTECQCPESTYWDSYNRDFKNQIDILGSKSNFQGTWEVRPVSPPTSLNDTPIFPQTLHAGHCDFKGWHVLAHWFLTWTSEEICIDLIHPLYSWGNWGLDTVTWDHLLLHNKVGNSKLSLLRQFRIRTTGSASNWVAWGKSYHLLGLTCTLGFIRSWTRSVFAKCHVLRYH